MVNNHLEQMVAEWYEYQGYFIRRNVLVGRRDRGGFESELDVVAFHPGSRHLVHVEASMDSASWERRESRYAQKFSAGRRYIPELFTGFELPDEIEQIAVLVYASKQNHQTLAGGKIVLANKLSRWTARASWPSHPLAGRATGKARPSRPWPSSSP